MVKYSPSSAVALESSDANSGTERRFAASIWIRSSTEQQLYNDRTAMEANVVIVGQAHRLPSENSPTGGVALQNHLPGEITNHAQPAKKHKPPSGVTAPNESRACGISAITYKLPLKIIMPVKSNHHAPRFAVPQSASTNSAIA